MKETEGYSIKSLESHYLSWFILLLCEFEIQNNSDKQWTNFINSTGLKGIAGTLAITERMDDSILVQERKSSQDVVDNRDGVGDGRSAAAQVGVKKGIIHLTLKEWGE